MSTTTDLTPERVLRRLEWRVIRRLDGRLQGDYRTLFRGAGIDVADLREYQSFDDVRHIDWNVTARTGIPHVRQYDEDREVTAWLVLDRSPSMGFGPVERRKHQVVTEIAATIAQLLARGGNSVGAVLFGAGDQQTIPPGHGRNQVLRIMTAVMNPPMNSASAKPIPREGKSRRGLGWLRWRRPPEEPAAGGVTDLSAPLRAALGIARRRSLIVIVSDFLTEPGWERPLSLLAQRHDVLAIQVSDPRESELPAVGMIYVEDAETGEQIFVNTSDPAFQQRLAAAAQQRQDELREIARSAGTGLFTIATDEDLVRGLMRIADRRRPGPRAGRSRGRR